MPRRIEIELTSTREDGSWTWRAAGAREPKGVVDGSTLPGGAKVGDVLRVEVEITLDGTEVTAVLPPKEAKAETGRLELIGRELKDDELVTSNPEVIGNTRSARRVNAVRPPFSSEMVSATNPPSPVGVPDSRPVAASMVSHAGGGP